MPKPSFFKPLLTVSSQIDETLERIETLKSQVERTESPEFSDLLSELEATLDDLKGAQDRIARARDFEKAIRTATV